MNDEPAGESESDSVPDPEPVPESESDSITEQDPDGESDTTAAQNRDSEDRSVSPADDLGSDGEPPADDPTAYVTDVRTLDSRIRWLWVVRSLLIGLIVGGIVTAAAFSAAPSWLWVGPLAFVLVSGLGVIHSVLLYRSWQYEVREDSLFLDRGVVTRVQTVVPYVRVQHIDTSRGPVERSIGLSTLVVYTAGSRGADVTIPGLTPPEADDLQTRLKALAIQSEGEDAV